MAAIDGFIPMEVCRKLRQIHREFGNTLSSNMPVIQPNTDNDPGVQREYGSKVGEKIQRTVSV